MKTEIAAAKNVYQCITAVSGAIAKHGIGKDRKNEQQGYKFRGIDDVYNALAPLLAEHGLVILPRVVARDCVERTSRSGAIQFFVTVKAEFDFVSAADGSKHVVETFGEAQDTGDKATNKAMSAAYKYAAFQTFCIPTEGDNDADAHTAEPSMVVAPVKTPTGETVSAVTGEVVPNDGQLRVNAVEKRPTQTGKERWLVFFNDGIEAWTFRPQESSLAEQLAQECCVVVREVKDKGRWGHDLVALGRAERPSVETTETPAITADEVPF